MPPDKFTCARTDDALSFLLEDGIKSRFIGSRLRLGHKPGEARQTFPVKYPPSTTISRSTALIAIGWKRDILPILEPKLSKS